MKDLEINIAAVFQDFRPSKAGDEEVRDGDKVALPTLQASTPSTHTANHPKITPGWEGLIILAPVVVTSQFSQNHEPSHNYKTLGKSPEV